MTTLVEMALPQTRGALGYDNGKAIAPPTNMLLRPIKLICTFFWSLIQDGLT